MTNSGWTGSSERAGGPFRLETGPQGLSVQPADFKWRRPGLHAKTPKPHFSPGCLGQQKCDWNTLGDDSAAGRFAKHSDLWTTIKSSLKATSDSVVNNCQFLSDALNEIGAKNKEEVAGRPGSALTAESQADGPGDADDEATGLADLRAEEELAADSEGKLEKWLNYLKTKYESFIVDADTRDELTEALKNTNLLT